MSERNDIICTGFLYSDPSILKGAGTVLNVWGNYYTFNYSATPEEADERAIANDWKVVGHDLQSAMGRAEEESALVQEAAQ